MYLNILEKGLIDFGLLFRSIDAGKYESVPISVKDSWGVLMRKDSPLALKESIHPEDLWDQPLILSHQRGDDQYLANWMGREVSALKVTATYNLVFNASLLVEEGLATRCVWTSSSIHREAGFAFAPFLLRWKPPPASSGKNIRYFPKPRKRF